MGAAMLMRRSDPALGSPATRCVAYSVHTGSPIPQSIAQQRAMVSFDY
jgi:hypothetical protein